MKRSYYSKTSDTFFIWNYQRIFISINWNSLTLSRDCPTCILIPVLCLYGFAISLKYFYGWHYLLGSTGVHLFVFLYQGYEEGQLSLSSYPQRLSSFAIDTKDWESAKIWKTSKTMNLSLSRHRSNEFGWFVDSFEDILKFLWIPEKYKE